jgi:hypothetical protein
MPSPFSLVEAPESPPGCPVGLSSALRRVAPDLGLLFYVLLPQSPLLSSPTDSLLYTTTNGLNSTHHSSTQLNTANMTPSFLHDGA